MRSKKGIVTSAKQEKTLVVTSHTYKRHPKYKKRFRTSKKYHVDNPENKKFEEGDEVTIYETRPLSKLKRWSLVEPQTNKPE
jgi:small subunit ribosomal protein S17